MNIFILDPIHPDALALLSADPGVRLTTWDMPQVQDWPQRAHAIIVRGSVVPGDAVRASRNLAVIGRHGAGYDKVDVDAVKEKGIALINTPFENTQSVAELAVALMLTASRNIPSANALVQKGEWAAARAAGGLELFEHPVGFVGYGRIAQAVAKILHSAFAMPVHAYDPYMTDEGWQAACPAATRCDDLNALFAGCDYISVHVPKTAATVGLIGKEQFLHAKKSLVLVNTARGGVVDETALYEALTQGRIRAAASDVFTREPLDAASPLLTCPNFTATPHYGGSTADSLRRVALAVARETLAALKGKGDAAYRVV